MAGPGSGPGQRPGPGRGGGGERQSMGGVEACPRPRKWRINGESALTAPLLSCRRSPSLLMAPLDRRTGRPGHISAGHADCWAVTEAAGLLLGRQ